MAIERPALRVIDPSASDEEVAAVIAALTVMVPSGPAPTTEAPSGSRWIAASRLASRRTGLSRGDWRLSGRIGRRARA